MNLATFAVLDDTNAVLRVTTRVTPPAERHVEVAGGMGAIPPRRPGATLVWRNGAFAWEDRRPAGEAARNADITVGPHVLPGDADARRGFAVLVGLAAAASAPSVSVRTTAGVLVTLSPAQVRELASILLGRMQ